MKIRVVIALPVLLMTGCATVQTHAPASGEIAGGVSYYLPRRDVKITIGRSVVKLEDAKKKVAAARKAVDEAEAADKSAATELKSQEALLATLAAGSDAWKNVEAARATAAGKKILSAASFTETKSKLALAEAEQARVEAVGGSQCIYKYDTKLELLAAVPDHSKRFVAVFSHNAFRDDDAKLSVTADGLLTSSNVVAADRSGEIIVELAGAIAGLGSGSGGMKNLEFIPRAAPDCEAAADRFVYQFDPVDFESANSRLVSSGYPLKLEFRSIQSECAEQISRETATDQQKRLRRCELQSAVVETEGKKGALFYRTSVPVTVIVEQCDLEAALKVNCSKAQPIDAALVMLPQLGPISYIPMRSSAFVKTVDDVTFSNGSITSWNATRPSEVLEVVRLPVKILTSIVSVPAQLVSLRINRSDKDKALAESQQAQIAAQYKLLSLKECVATAEREGTSPGNCFVE